MKGNERMAQHVDAHWQVTWDAPSKADRRGGIYQAYVPDLLSERRIVISARIARYSTELESAIRRLAEHTHADSMDGLARFLLRSEAIASSRIEGLHASPQKIALAELAAESDEPVRGFTDTARLIANNIMVLRRAVSEYAAKQTMEVEDVCQLHRGLLPDDRHHGLRTVQNWIGGGDANPLNAAFVPPPPDSVEALMTDLTEYLSYAGHAPLVQAALVHAQFETIHPFTDGNGRIGRALIHTVLTRRGLTRTAVLPISLALRTRSDQYIDGLTEYRYIGMSDSPQAAEATENWFRIFLGAVDIAVAQAEILTSQLAETFGTWTLAHRSHRKSRGLRAEPRRDSAVARLLRMLPEAPLLTARSVQRLLNVTHPAARAALEELAEAGILRRKSVERGTTGYLARDIFDMLTFAERQLASTQWDTKLSAPGRPVPARPQHT